MYKKAKQRAINKSPLALRPRALTKPSRKRIRIEVWMPNPITTTPICMDLRPLPCQQQSAQRAVVGQCGIVEKEVGHT